MRYVAERGDDVYALDIRGYGGSTRPAAMSQPPEANPPFAGTREAVRDITAAVDYILASRKVGQLSLVGWSWGTTTTAAFAAEQPSKVGRLVLFAPVWLGVQPPNYQGAWRASTREARMSSCSPAAGGPAFRRVISSFSRTPGMKMPPRQW